MSTEKIKKRQFFVKKRKNALTEQIPDFNMWKLGGFHMNKESNKKGLIIMKKAKLMLSLALCALLLVLTAAPGFAAERSGRDNCRTAQGDCWGTH